MKRIYIAIGAFAVVAVVIVAMPARVFAMFVDQYGISLLDTRGTVWNGSAEVIAPSINVGRLHWRFKAQSLLSATLQYELSVDNPALRLEGTITKKFAHSDFAAQATIEPSLVNSVLLHYGIKIGGRFQVDDVELRVGSGNTIQSLTGTVNWEGGTTRYRLENQSRVVTLPAAIGELSLSSNEVLLTAVDMNNNNLLQIRLEVQTGVAHVALSQYLLEQAELPTQEPVDANEYALTVSQQLAL